MGPRTVALAAVLASMLCGGCRRDDVGPLPVPPPPNSADAGYELPSLEPCSDAVSDAMREGTADAVARAAKAGAQFTCGTHDDPLPLDAAILDNRPVGMVEALLVAGANPNARWLPRGDRFPLQEVLEQIVRGARRTRLIELLLAHKADPNMRWCPFESRGQGRDSCRSATGVTPLWSATVHDDVAAVFALLRAGADPLRPVMTGELPIDQARSEGSFWRLLEAMGASVPATSRERIAWFDARVIENPWSGPWDDTALSRAVAGTIGHWGVSTPPLEEHEATSAARQVTRGRLSFTAGRARALLDLGAEPDRRMTARGVDWTPLSLAIANRDGDMADVLLGGGARVDLRWCVPVRTVWTRKRTDPAPPGCTLDTGMTPLMLAAATRNDTIVDLLLRRSADPFAVDWRGRTALEHARLALPGAPTPLARTRAIDVQRLLREAAARRRELKDAVSP